MAWKEPRGSKCRRMDRKGAGRRGRKSVFNLIQRAKVCMAYAIITSLVWPFAGQAPREQCNPKLFNQFSLDPHSMFCHDGTAVSAPQGAFSFAAVTSPDLLLRMIQACQVRITSAELVMSDPISVPNNASGALQTTELPEIHKKSAATSSASLCCNALAKEVIRRV